MNFTEEKTPAGYNLKILLNKSKFLVFNNRGESFSSDNEGRSLLHKLPTAVFVGSVFIVERDYFKDYMLAKVKDEKIILQYRDITEKKRKLLFIDYQTPVDLIPIKILVVKSYSSMLRDIPSDTDIDFLIVDESLSEVEVSVIASRYKPKSIIEAFTEEDKKSEFTQDNKTAGYISINTMSDNSVFLASYHLKNMALSNLNQLLLDFDLTALDIQFIIHFINDILEKKKDNSEVIKNRPRIIDLKNVYEFYLALILKDEDSIKEKLEAETDYRKLSPYRTLISKIRSMSSGKEEQLLYTEFENLIFEREEKLKTGQK
ncbi:MAG: hypothetical protein FWF73_01620 [Spirochaetes bacterium]|nr:hypothetical protein [Spirochaetota bacterium]